MQKTIAPTSEREVVAQAKCRVERHSARMLHLVSFVPDDKLTWAPSSTARTSLRILAHSALTNRFFARIITGTMPGNMPTPEEFFRALHEGELKIDTRESAIALFQETTAELCKAIDGINAENINSAPNSPFGPISMQFWMGEGSEHLANHNGQLAYIQTLWGDLDDHFVK